jgi:hypothetical protein
MDITRQALRLYISEQIENRLKSALQQETESISTDQKAQSKGAENGQTKADDYGIFTSEEELEGHRIVRAILRELVDAKRVALRRQQSQSYLPFALQFFPEATRHYQRTERGRNRSN